jgi:glycosyltransferase involved in cell wall biosynthesis
MTTSSIPLINDKILDSGISLVLPIYAENSVLEETIISIRNQVKPFDEIIIIDDNPKIQSREKLIQDLLGKDVQFTYVKNSSNMGSAGSFNYGIGLSKGQTIVLCNDDDLFEPTRVQRVSNYVRANTSDVYWGFSSVECIDNSGIAFDSEKVPGFLRAAIEASSNPDSFHRKVKNMNPVISTGNLFFSRKLWDKVGGFNVALTHVHDWEFATKLSVLSEPIYLGDEKYFYRIHPDNSFRKIKRKDTESQITILRMSCEDFVWSNGNLESVCNYFPELIIKAEGMEPSLSHHDSLNVAELRMLHLFNKLVQSISANKVLFGAGKFVFGKIESLTSRR